METTAFKICYALQISYNAAHVHKILLQILSSNPLFKYSTVQYNTVQYNTVQYSTVQYSIVQCKYSFIYSLTKTTYFQQINIMWNLDSLNAELLK
jgi:hypothetical protein